VLSGPPSTFRRPWRFAEQLTTQGGDDAGADAGLAAARRAQQAREWGYDSVGQVLPEELTVSVVAEATLFGRPAPRQREGEDPAAAAAAAAAARPGASPDPADPRSPALLATALRAALSLAVMAAGYAWMWHMRTLLPAWQTVLCWLAIGTAYFGLFQGVGGDAARGALLGPSRAALRDAIGAAVMAPALWSYESWRARWWAFVCRPALLTDALNASAAGGTDRLAAEAPFHVQPLTLERLSGFAPAHRRAHRLLRATPLRFFGPSLVAWFRGWDALDLRRWDGAQRMAAMRGWLAPMLFVAAAWPALARFGAAVVGPGCSGLGGWAVAWLGPWMFFHMWTSVLALAQRTGPHAVWTRRPTSARAAAEGGCYDYTRGLVSASATLSLPRWLEVLIHDANYHLPAAIASACCLQGVGPSADNPGGVCAVPSPRLRDAHLKRLRPRLGLFLTEGRLLRPRLLLNLMTGWLVFDEQGSGTYVDWDEAVEKMREARQRRKRRKGGGGEAEEEAEGAAAAPAAAA